MQLDTTTDLTRQLDQALAMARTLQTQRDAAEAERDGLLRCGSDTLALLESYKAGDGLHTTINIWDDLIARWQGWMATEAGVKARAP